MITRRLSITILILLHSIFILSVIYANIQNLWILSGGIFVLLLTGFAYYKTPRKKLSIDVYELTGILFAVLGAIMTYLLNDLFQMGPVLAASGIGLIGTLIPTFKRDSSYLKNAPAAIYCGAFAGMTSPQLATGIQFISIAGIVAGILFILSKNVLAGYGGKLGTLAFGGVMASTAIYYIIS